MLAFVSREEWSKRRSKNAPSLRLSDYASPQEIGQLRAILIARFKMVTGQNAEDIRFKRGLIRSAIRQIDRGQIPSKADATEDLLATIRSKYEAARQIVPDEAAWEIELMRRAALEERYGSVV